MSVAVDSITVTRMQSVQTPSGDTPAPANLDTWGTEPSAEVSLLVWQHRQSGRLCEYFLTVTYVLVTCDGWMLSMVPCKIYHLENGSVHGDDGN